MRGSNMATQTDGSGLKDRTGTSSWAGIVGGAKSDTPGDARNPPPEESPVNPEPGEGAAGAHGGDLDPEELSQFTEIRTKKERGKKKDEDLDPEELSQFTEIRTKKDRAKRKEGVRGGRKDRRGGGEGVPRGRGGKRPGRDLPLRQQNGPEVGEEEAVEESPPPPEGESEEKVLYVPAPAPSVNIWEKRQSIPAPAKPAGCVSPPAPSEYSRDFG